MLYRKLASCLRNLGETQSLTAIYNGVNLTTFRCGRALLILEGFSFCFRRYFQIAFIRDKTRYYAGDKSIAEVINNTSS